MEQNDKTPAWTDEQLRAMEQLLKVKCLRDEGFCTGQWCRARRRISLAFGIQLSDEKKEKKFF
jgi:hypothetical protein